MTTTKNPKKESSDDEDEAEELLSATIYTSIGMKIYIENENSRERQAVIHLPLHEQIAMLKRHWKPITISKRTIAGLFSFLFWFLPLFLFLCDSNH